MRTRTRIGGIFKRHIGDTAFLELQRIYSADQTAGAGHVFNALLPQDDSRTHELLRYLTEVGYTPWTDKSREIDRGREFLIEYHREYDRTDFESAEYLELRPSAYGSGEYRDEETGAIKLEVDRLDNSWDFSLARGERYAVPERVKRVIESAAMRHVVFRPTLLCDPAHRVDGSDKTIPWDTWGPPWWEITSDYTLPPVSLALDLRDFRGRPVERGNPHIRYLRKEGFYLYPELRYRRDDLRRTEPFDLARTFECFGGEPRWNERTLVASKRFYDFCQLHHLKVGWVPVRVDE